MALRLRENNLMCQVIRYGNFIETAGQVATNPAMRLEDQAKQALESVSRLLEEAGASLDDLVRVQVWLADINQFDQFNMIYQEWLQGRPKPVRACVESNLVAGGYLVEIQAFAYVDD